ncbi:ABC transporter ATP-binding protein (plasmid) [Halobacterium sp. MBLA0001]|uniref:ABC transporter ATP-binding protein n=1 Tax=Halobacterium sp. MBLA0001 TaxID=3413511 RepID=UPI003C7968F1
MSDIELRNVEKQYGTVSALDGVSLAIDSGETAGLIGRNGAGKTTLFKLLVGHETPDAGSVSVAGLSSQAGAALREHVGYLPEHAGFPPSVTGREVLEFHARVRDVAPDTRGRRVERVLNTVGLAEAADRRVGGYSNGMNRRLGLATTLVGDPDVLLLDEPTAALDPTGVADFHEVVEALSRKTDVTILVTSHVLSEVERLCDRVVVLDEGAVQAAGTVADLRRETAETVSVDATVDDEPGEVVADVEDCGGVTTATATSSPPQVHINCQRDAVFEVLERLRASTDVVDVEVTEPGLDAVFRDTVSTDRAISVSATRGEGH